MLSRKRWLYALIGVLGMLLFGACYAWGVFVAPLEKQYGLARAQTSFVFTLNLLAYAGGIVLAGWLARHVKFPNLARLGAILLGGGFMLASQATSIAGLYLTFSILCGAGAGICYNVVISAVPQWFPDKSGLITGIILIGYALSTAIFGPAAHICIENFGASATFFMIGAFCGGGLLLLSFGMRPPTPEEKAKLPGSGKNAGIESGGDVPTRCMLRKFSFWITFFVLGFTSGTGLIVINHISPLLTEELAASATTASYVISLIFLCNACGRIVSGWVIDKTGFGFTLLSINILMPISLFVLLLGMRQHSLSAVILGSALSLFTFGANVSMIPNAVRTLFGQKYFPLNYSLMNVNILIASFMPTLGGYMQAYFHGYSTLILYLVFLAMLTMLLTIFLLRNKNVAENQEKVFD